MRARFIHAAASFSVGRRMSAIAVANNDAAFIAWKYDARISQCLGFAVYRTDLNSAARTPLPAWVGFQGESNENWQPQTTEHWPVQKFNWRDLTAKPGGFYQYQVVPMVGTQNNLTQLGGKQLTTNPVHLGAERGNTLAYFNRGILSTQSIAHLIPPGAGGKPNYRKLVDRIDQPGDPLRISLAGDLIRALPLLLERASSQAGECYLALYELTDPELLQLLIGSPFVHVILSNTGPDDSENAAARQTLHESHVDITDRMLTGDHIGHNKFAVYVDSKKQPQAVLTGSTNWTATGLCGQANNALIIESSTVAAFYLDYWNRLKADTLGGDLQGAQFRTANRLSHSTTLDNGKTNLTLWFSPNTEAKSKPSQNPPSPLDMKNVFDALDNAKQAILFLAFEPGTPSIIDKVAECENANPNLFIRGAVSQPKTVEQYNVHLYHRSGVAPDAEVVAAAAIEDEFSFWHAELLKASPTAHAIIHDKVVVIDPFTPNCVVITGSHNLGYKASYANDENMLIISGNLALAAAYTASVMDVYDHYRWRYQVQTKGPGAWSGLQLDDTWQDKYFEPNNLARKEMEFWNPP
jgi:phosphatidylserine/phosphatidylglycerophosphate/cardiolipin synthase-like enzyme